MPLTPSLLRESRDPFVEPIWEGELGRYTDGRRLSRHSGLFVVLGAPLALAPRFLCTKIVQAGGSVIA